MRKIKKKNNTKKESDSFISIVKEDLYELDNGTYVKGKNLKSGMRIKSSNNDFITINTIEEVTSDNISELKREIKEKIVYQRTSKYVKAEDLRPGMELRTADGRSIKIDKIVKKKLEKYMPVYNIEVEGNHNYFVGDTGVLVHNKNLEKTSENSFTEIVKDKKAATIDELIEMMNKRDNVTARFAEDDSLRFMEQFDIEGHCLSDSSSCLIEFNSSTANRKTGLHEWMHRTLFKKHGNNKPEFLNTPAKEEMYIENFLKRYEKTLKIEELK